MRKLIFAISFLLLILSSFSTLAQGDKIEVNFFYSKACPHCAQEKTFLEEIEKRYPEVQVNKLSVSENIGLLENFYSEYKIPTQKQGWVPITFINDKYFLGFDKEIGEEIENCILLQTEGKKPRGLSEENNKISLPLIGEIESARFSLPVLSVVLGFFDGFNVCSLGALILILGLVLALRQKRKILMFGGIFIITTAVVYGFLIILWHQIFSLLAPYLRTMEIAIGLLGICGGVYFLRNFIRYIKYGPACETGFGRGVMARLSNKIKKSLQEPGNILLVIGSILLFAATVTIVEFPCSAAIPVFFAGVLAKAQLSAFWYLLYIAIFVFFYMADEIIVFLIAFFTMTIKLASPRFVVWITLLEAIILFGLGLYYLFGLGVLS